MHKKLLRTLCEFVDLHQNEFISVLDEIASITSVSGIPEYREDCIKACKWTVDKLKCLGFEVEEHHLGPETFPVGKKVRRPPIVLGSLGNDSSKLTVCFYGQLDIVLDLPTEAENGNTPSQLPDSDRKHGPDNKGPLLCWLNAIHTYRTLDIPLPVNIRIIIDTMYHYGSFGLQPLIKERAGSFFRDIDVICISTNCWFEAEEPSLTYGVLGHCHFHVSVWNESRLTHKNRFTNDCMSDILYLLDGLVDKQGTILIPNIYDNITEVTDEERLLLSTVKLDFCSIKKKLSFTDLNDGPLLNRLWKYPSLSIHEVFTSPYSPNRGIAPKTVYAKFSIRLVPGQTVHRVQKLVTSFMQERWNTRQSSNTLKLHMASSNEPWITDFRNTIFKAAIHAAEYVYKVTPKLTLEGGQYFEASTFHRLLGKEVIMIPLCPDDESDFSTGNKNISATNYIKGTKFISVFLFKLPLFFKSETKSNIC